MTSIDSLLNLQALTTTAIQHGTQIANTNMASICALFFFINDKGKSPRQRTQQVSNISLLPKNQVKGSAFEVSQKLRLDAE